MLRPLLRMLCFTFGAGAALIVACIPSVTEADINEAFDEEARSVSGDWEMRSSDSISVHFEFRLSQNGTRVTGQGKFTSG